MVSRILLVEDEAVMRESIELKLKKEGYEVVAVADGYEALKVFREQRFNLIVLDIMMPELDGYSVCEQIRLDNTNVPILFLTAKDSTQDMIQGLQKGGDDYLTKPFNDQVFLLRVNSLIRRGKLGTPAAADLNQFVFGNNVVNFSTYKASCNIGDISLTKKEAKLLKLLIVRDKQVVSREEILQNVWGYDVFPSTRTIDNFILAFRKYFEKNPRKPEFFHSVRGVGYKFTSIGPELSTNP